MRFTIDVDTGGTHTHGFIAGDGTAKTVTTPTTPHDLTVCLADCVKQAAEAFGLSVKELLLNADIVRYSTTTATNAASPACSLGSNRNSSGERSRSRSLANGRGAATSAEIAARSCALPKASASAGTGQSSASERRRARSSIGLPLIWPPFVVLVFY